MDKEILTVIHDTEKFYEMKTNCLKYDLSFHMVKSIETTIENLLHSQNYVLILIYLDDLDIIGKLKKFEK